MNGASGVKRCKATIVNQRGLHARAAARLAKVAGRFDAEIMVATGSHTVSALSIMGLLMLGATKGVEIEIRANGADAEAAIDTLVRLIANGFEEEDFPGY